MNTTSASSVATYGPGSRKRTRRSGRASIATTTPIGTKIDVYFEANASPSTSPAASHQRKPGGEPGACRSARTTQ